jgi:hypothetical protein
MPCNKAAFEAYVHCDVLANVNVVEWGSTGSHAMEMANRQAFSLCYDLEDCQRLHLPQFPLKNLQLLKQRQLLSTSNTASRTGTEHSRLALTQEYSAPMVSLWSSVLQNGPSLHAIDLRVGEQTWK